MSDIQYTIRNIPPAVDKYLKRRAKFTHLSFNKTVVDHLSKNIVGESKPTNRFGWLFGSMNKQKAKKFDEAINLLNMPDPEFWK